LNKVEQQILAAILEKPAISGAELMKYTGAGRPNHLIEPVRRLQQNKLIEVSGDTLTEKMFPYASFTVRLRSKAELYDLLHRQSWQA
jgi:hypothetical protein